jgi:hypothetical protein
MDQQTFEQALTEVVCRMAGYEVMAYLEWGAIGTAATMGLAIGALVVFAFRPRPRRTNW